MASDINRFWLSITNFYCPPYSDQRDAFDSTIICVLSSLMMRSDGIQGLISGYISFISLLILTIIFVTKACTRVSEVAAWWTLDSCVCKHMAIDTEYVSGATTEGEAINNAIMTYMPLSLCNGFLAVLFCFLESNIAGFVVTKAVLSDEQSKNHNSKSKDH